MTPTEVANAGRLQTYLVMTQCPGAWHNTRLRVIHSEVEMA